MKRARETPTTLCNESGRKEMAHRLDVCAMVYAHQPADYERCVREACTLVTDFEDWKTRPAF